MLANLLVACCDELSAAELNVQLAPL